MTPAKPLARYRAIEGALASGFVTAQLHHAAGHDPSERDAAVRAPIRLGQRSGLLEDVERWFDEEFNQRRRTDL